MSGREGDGKGDSEERRGGKDERRGTPCSLCSSRCRSRRRTTQGCFGTSAPLPQFPLIRFVSFSTGKGQGRTVRRRVDHPIVVGEELVERVIDSKLGSPHGRPEEVGFQSEEEGEDFFVELGGRRKEQSKSQKTPKLVSRARDDVPRAERVRRCWFHSVRRPSW